MKKLLLLSTVIILVVSCHKKERTEYFTKAGLEHVLQSENKEDSLFFNHWFKVANVYYNLKELEIYKYTCERIVSYAQQVKDTLNLAKGYEYMGDYYKEQSLKDSTYYYYLKAEKYYTLVKDKESIGRMIFNKASVQYNDGDLARSEMFCLEALHYFNDVKGKSQGNIYDTYNLLGMLANDQKQYHKALEYHNKALQILAQDSSMTNSELLKSATLNNIGISYRNKNENKQALFYFSQALETKDLPQRLPALYAMLLDNTAYSRFKLKDDTGVKDLFYKALRIREMLNIASGIVMSKLHMSEYYQKQKDTKKAFIFADEAYKTAKTKGTDPRNVMLSLKQLERVNAPLKEAYVIEYNRISDSLSQAQSKIHEAISQELAQAQAKEEAEMKKKEKYKTSLIELGVIVCFLGVNYVLHRRNKQRIKRDTQKKAELEANDQEKQAHIQEKEAQIKIYDLMVAKNSKAKNRLNKQRFSLVIKFYDSLIHRILGQRLFLETLKDKKAQVYRDDLKRLEEEVNDFYDFCKDIFHETQEADHKHYLSLVHKLLNQQKKQTTVTDYIEVKWDHLDNALKMHLYRTLENCFKVINKNKQITYVNVEMYDDDEEREGVIQLYITCNEDLKVEDLQDISKYVKKIGGLFQVNKHEEEGNTKLELFFATNIVII